MSVTGRTRPWPNSRPVSLELESGGQKMGPVWKKLADDRGFLSAKIDSKLDEAAAMTDEEHEELAFAVNTISLLLRVPSLHVLECSRMQYFRI